MQDLGASYEHEMDPRAHRSGSGFSANHAHPHCANRLALGPLPKAWASLTDTLAANYAESRAKFAFVTAMP